VKVDLDFTPFNIPLADYLTEFESGLFLGDRHRGQSPVGFGQDAEDLAGSFDLQDIHEPYWEPVILSDDSVYLDFSSADNSDCLFRCSGVS